MQPNNVKREDEKPYYRYRQRPSGADDIPNLSYHEARILNPGDEIFVHHNNQDDNTVLTDLQTVEYEVGQRNLFPTAQDLSDDSSTEFNHPILDVISEGDGRSASTPGSGRSISALSSLNPVPFDPDSNVTAKDMSVHEKQLKPDDNWKEQLDSKIWSLPTGPPKLPFDDQGKASQEEPKIKSAATAEQDPSWKQDLESEKMAQPTPSCPVASQNVEYNQKGRATKSSLVQDAATASRVGAWAQAGPGLPAPLSAQIDTGGNVHENGLVRDSSGEGHDVRESSPSQASESEDIHIAEADLNTVLFWPRTAIAGVVLVIVAVAVVVALVISKDDGRDPILGLNTKGSEEILYIAPIPDLPEYTLAELEVKDSIQHQAYVFATMDPNWNSYEDWRKQQRFAMLCFFFAFGGTLGRMVAIGEHWYVQHECEWSSAWTHRCPGGDDGIVRVMTVYGDSFTSAVHVPPEVSLLSHLEVLDFVESKLVSIEWVLPLSIPNTLASLTKLNIVGSGITGSIPSTVGLLSSLINLDLSDNHLESTLPSELGLLSNLTSIILSENGLSGTLPDELGNLSSLEILELEDNSGVEPNIPSGFCSTNRTNWHSMKTDWCSNPTDCCTLLDQISN